jgi:glycosyltransferase involved in cell wall biosynthesis
MSRPLISIIIPSWNHGALLLRCLASLEVQTYSSFEVIVVDDASTDDTQTKIKSVHLRYPLRVIRLEKNSGAPVARNRGALEAKGEYVLFLDADIELRPHALEVMVSALEKSGAQFAYPSFRFGWKLFKGFPFDAERLKHMPYIHTSALMKRDIFPGFDESLKKFQDWDLWLTISEKGGKGVWIPEVLFDVQTRKEGMSQWLPSLFHAVPWHWVGWMPRELKKYRYWEKVVKEKHHIGL